MPNTIANVQAVRYKIDGHNLSQKFRPRDEQLSKAGKDNPRAGQVKTRSVISSRTRSGSVINIFKQRVLGSGLSTAYFAKVI